VPLAPPTSTERLLEQLGIKPLSSDLLVQALTHASYVNESDATAVSNDRLEFLGDALLGLVVADSLHRSFPDSGEGQLTRMRAEVVRGSTLAGVARRLGLGEYLVMGRGEEAAGGRDRERNLAGAFEALVGAVFLDHGYRSARTFALRVLDEELVRVRSGGTLIDPKSSLQHLVQARWHEPPDYVTVEESTGDAGRRFTVEVVARGRTLGRGAGSSKREAQQAAAREAVAHLLEEGGEGA
jgi:ribonuclease III